MEVFTPGGYSQHTRSILKSPKNVTVSLSDGSTVTRQHDFGSFKPLAMMMFVLAGVLVILGLALISIAPLSTIALIVTALFITGVGIIFRYAYDNSYYLETERYAERKTMGNLKRILFANVVSVSTENLVTSRWLTLADAQGQQAKINTSFFHAPRAVTAAAITLARKAPSHQFDSYLNDLVNTLSCRFTEEFIQHLRALNTSR